MLGIAVKAGACVFGFEALLKGIRSGRVRLALVDESASLRSKKTISDKCRYYSAAYIETSPPGELGKRCGRSENRMVGVTKDEFIKKLLEISEVQCP